MGVPQVKATADCVPLLKKVKGQREAVNLSTTCIPIDLLVLSTTIRRQPRIIMAESASTRVS